MQCIVSLVPHKEKTSWNSLLLTSWGEEELIEKFAEKGEHVVNHEFRIDVVLEENDVKSMENHLLVAG